MSKRRSEQLRKSIYRDYDDFFPQMSTEDDRFFHHYVTQEYEPLKIRLKMYADENDDDPEINTLLLAKRSEPEYKQLLNDSINDDQIVEGEKESLLEVPVSRLKREILNEIAENKPADDQILSEQLAATSIVANPNQNQKLLWTDRYMPQHFFELLSDEQTNREVLTWLKAWNPIVFKTKVEILLINNSYKNS